MPGRGLRQESAGVSDSFEQMLAYLRLEVGDAVSQATLENSSATART